MPNGFAYLMLFSWPLVAHVMFTRMPVYKALIWTMMAGYLILPSATSFKIPMLPLLDKHSIPTISAFVLCWIHAPRESTVKNSPLITGLLVLMVASPFMTVMTNAEPVIVGPLYLPSLRPYDALSMISGAAILVLPFLMARRHINTPEAHRELLRAFAIGGLAYTLPALAEVRLSPQLHILVYGFFPSDFIQHLRAGGFRPVVFLNHGLMIGILFCLSFLACLALWRDAIRMGQPARRWLFAAVWVLFTLALSKSVGALVISVALGLISGLAGRQMQIMFAAIIAVLVLFYPTLRSGGYVPVERIHEIAESYSEARAQSLKFRLDNEDGLLARANEKPVFGWGGWGRNQLYDSETGRSLSVLDGIWVILIGIYGWAGYIAYFGLWTVPILQYARDSKRLGSSLITPGLMILLSANLIDFLPNAGMVPYVWMIAGAIAGIVTQRVDLAQTQLTSPVPTTTPQADRGLRPLLD